MDNTWILYKQENVIIGFESQEHKDFFSKSYFLKYGLKK